MLYQDADVAVIDKPAGMVVHPGAGHPSGTLVNALLHHMEDLSGIGGELRPGIVHRLDRGTSGVMVVAKNDAAHQELARQFHDREVEKEYIALVWGVVQAGRRIDAAIGRDPADRMKMSARAKHARHAVTRITRAMPLPGLTLCQVAIHTGRTHQIRVHLSAIGHPIVGDAVYGGVHRRVAGDIRAVQRLERPFLHAARLVFHHPADRRRMEFLAPLPSRSARRARTISCRRSCGARSPEPGAWSPKCPTRPPFPTPSTSSTPAASSPSRSNRSRCPTGCRSRRRSSAIPDRWWWCRWRTTAQLVLVRQYRHAVGRHVWELPAGTLKPGEVPDEAARRECQEEIGLIAERLDYLGAYYPTPGYCDELMRFYRATGLRRPVAGDPEAHADEDEDIETGRFDRDAVRGMIASGEIVDLKTIGGLALLPKD